MTDDPFRQAVHLFQSLGMVPLRSGENLRTELRLGQQISLWDVVASYLVLYRFPLLFSKNDGDRVGSGRLRQFLRPYRGLAACFRDSLMSCRRRSAAACEKWPARKTAVLFLGFVPTFYRDVLRPVAESLVSKAEIKAVVLGDNPHLPENCRTDQGVLFQSPWGHWSADVEKCAKRMSAHLGHLQGLFFSRDQYKAVMANIEGRVRRFALSREFYWLFWREFRRLIPQLAVANHILDVHRPALIISADDADQRCRVYSLLAREKRIPSLLVQQGLTGRDYPEWMFFSHTTVAAMGEASRRDMCSQGVPDQRIVVTGHPGFDHLIRPEAALQSRIRRELGIENTQKMILFASQPYYVGVFATPAIREEMIRALAQTCRSIPNVTLVVKPHPGDNVHELKGFIGNSAQCVLVDHRTDISPFIKACDVLVTFFSTVGLQALYAGKPVINLSFPNSGGLGLYADSGATWVARSKAELASHIRYLISEDRKNEMASRETARQRFLTDTVYLPDGQATERVLQVAMNLLCNNQTQCGGKAAESKKY